MLAVTATVAVTSDASAKQKYWPQPFPMHHHNFNHYNNGSGFFFSTPFFFGLQFGPQYQQYPRFAGNPHIQWCASHYKTYNPYTNTFFIKKGVPAVCVSPYSSNWRW